jgi:hypothetical protein
MPLVHRIIMLKIRKPLSVTFHLYKIKQKMHLVQTNILIYDVFYMFRTLGFIFTKTVVYTSMVRYVLHAPV